MNHDHWHHQCLGFFKCVAQTANGEKYAGVQGVAGSGLIGVAKDNLPRKGTPPGMIVGYVELEIDVDTGKYEILEYVAVADCGTVMHPQGFSQQMNGGGVWA